MVQVKKKQLPRYMTTVTPFSTVLAVILFVILPLATFHLGRKVQIHIDRPLSQNVSSVSKKSNAMAFTFQIKDGSLYKLLSNGQQELFISKTQLHDPQLTDISIESFTESPDKTKLLLFAFGGITPSLLYSVDVSSRMITPVGYGIEAVWSPDSRYIAYNRSHSDAGSKQLYIFDTITSKNIDFVKPQNYEMTDYSNLHWKNDSNAITTTFETRDGNPYGSVIARGETTITIR